MNQISRVLILLLLSTGALGSIYGEVEEPSVCFLVLDAESNQVVTNIGNGYEQRVPPCSTFKIVLALMGFDTGLLTDEDNPKWIADTQDQPLEMWKGYHTPRSWLANSVLWYSQRLAPKIGKERIEDYLAQLQYGNQDMSGDPGMDNGLTHAWLNSSLTISPLEQADFLTQLVQENLPLSSHAQRVTKSALFERELHDGWKLYGKTGTSSFTQDILMWYVGWVERDAQTFVFVLRMTHSPEFLTREERRTLALELLRPIMKNVEKEEAQYDSTKLLRESV